MCGRYTLTVPGERLAELFGLEEVPVMTPRYNVAPTQAVPMVRAPRELTTAHWGLIPFWAEDRAIGNRMINARAETVADKPAFRTSFRRRRCLVPADGFYEWASRHGGAKQPYFIHLATGDPFAFAGLWDRWRGPAGEVDSCTLLTTRPNELVAPLHDRMPVILRRDDYDLWLDPKVTDSGPLEPLLRPYDAAPMEAYPVSRFVNRPGNDSPRCIERVS